MENRNLAVKISDSVEQMNVAPLMASASLPINQVQELADQGFIQSINMSSGSDVVIQYDIAQFNRESRIFNLLSEIGKMNETKRKNTN
jgi:hypothetical protein